MKKGHTDNNSEPNKASSPAIAPSAPQIQPGPPGYGPPQTGYPVYYQYGYPPNAGSDPRTGWQDIGGLDLSEILKIIWLKKSVVISIFVFAFVLWCLYIITAPRIYQAESELELSLRRPRILGQQDAVIDDVSRMASPDVLNTQFTKLKSESLRRKVAVALRSVYPDAKVVDAEEMGAFLEKNVRIDLVRRTSLVRFAVQSEDPALAVKVANTYADEAVIHAYSLNKEMSKNAVAWLESQIETERKALDDMEAKLLEFAKKNPLETMDARRETIKNSLLQYNEELTAAVATREKLLSRYTVNHPEVKTQDQLIELVRKQYESEVLKAETLESAVATARTQLKSLERERESREITYKGVLRRMEEARLSADENTATVKITEIAETPKTPIKPRRMLTLLVALFLGAGCGIGVAIVTHRLEDRVWGFEDAEQELGIKVLGSVPHSEELRAQRDLALVSINDKFSVLLEAYSVVRSLMDKSAQYKTFLITSAEPSEGKTVSSCNLAIVSAKSGKKTLLIDFDMRRPKLAGIWGFGDPKWSLLHALCDAQTPDFSRLPGHTELENLDVVVSHGAKDINPADVMGSRRVRELLEWAAANYDRVIVDSPPVGVASDTMVLGGLVDACIVVLRFNKTQKSMARGAVSMLQDGGATILGTVINDVDMKKVGNWYSRYGGSYYRGAYERYQPDSEGS